MARPVKEPVSVDRSDKDVRVISSRVQAMRTLAYDVILTLHDFFTICHSRLVHV
jgi:hypothetical protein